MEIKRINNKHLEQIGVGTDFKNNVGIGYSLGEQVE